MNGQVNNGLTVSPFEYQQLKRLGLSLIERTSDKCPVIFIGVGRTPTPLMAFIECYLGSDQVIILPLSGFRHNYPGENISLLREPLSRDQMIALSDHLQRFISDVRLKKKSHWVVVDFVDSGASLAAATEYLRHYLRKNGIPDGHICAAALSATDLPACFTTAMKQLSLEYMDFPIHESKVERTDKVFRLGRGDYYDLIAPVKRAFKISEGHLTQMLVENKTDYYDYMRQIAEYMIEDVDIENPISGSVQTRLYDSCRVEKKCQFSSDARALHRQYNSFPAHVRSQLQGCSINYLFTTGETLEVIVRERHGRVSELVNNLADFLAKLHWAEPIIIKEYEKICAVRKLDRFQEINENTYGYFTRIHGDLHLRNILMAPNYELVFIDRMRQCGDMMYDFPFILSLLCFERIYNDGYFHSLVVGFFQVYEQYVDDIDNFHRAFLVNFINYAQIAHATYMKSSPPFEEWVKAAGLSMSASCYNDFKTFLLNDF